MTSTWLHDLPLWQMTLVVFGAAGIVGAGMHFVAGWLAAGAHRRSFVALSPGLLSPIGVIFGLLIAFTAAQVWNDTAQANAAVDTEAGALRSVVVLSAVFPEDARMQLRKLIREYIEYTATTEWKSMAQGAVTLKISPPTLNKAMQFALSLPANTPGQQTAQRQVAVSLEQALEARRQRILVSRSEVSGVKWLCLSFLAACLVLAIALIHCENRMTSAIAIALFCACVATAMLLILSHDRPFSGAIAVSPEPLWQVIPEDQ
ncbi:hypothetical protein NOV72_02797 [Caballeronia novacaledonica]|uniref:DUF4239 domain-containing protein n=1 Tax=Caballeronia novacaledonica TaxID=1544861 RepID=A0A2U3I647_9BURK|nr:DUF4239 domain-containing protein [Caballeronia novacaledonica]SPB15577.1 hypothetical protein NOV72_02797 [Caballeronia novacaledonica]